MRLWRWGCPHSDRDLKAGDIIIVTKLLPKPGRSSSISGSRDHRPGSCAVPEEAALTKARPLTQERMILSALLFRKTREGAETRGLREAPGEPFRHTGMVR